MTTTTKKSEIIIELSEDGVGKVQIAADTDDEQTAAHNFLARITPALRTFHASVKLAGAEF